MPKSKRDKKISLTRTKKKGLESKQKLVAEIRKCIENYARVFVFTVKNMRNSKLHEVRMEWKQSGRFFLGKNKVMALALGRTQEEEVAENLHQISSRLVGSCGILFTNNIKEEVLKYFDNMSEPGFARSGNVATREVILDQGPLEQFPHSIEPQLRQLGLPTKLDRGVPTLFKDHTVCKEGELLSPEQARILKLLGIEMSQFTITMECMWTRHNGDFDDFGRTVLKQKNNDDEMEYDSKGEEEINEDESPSGGGGDDDDDDDDDILLIN